MGWGRGNKVSEGNEEVGVFDSQTETSRKLRVDVYVYSTLNACTCFWFLFCFYIYLLVLGISDFSRLTAIGFKYTKNEDMSIVQILTCTVYCF